LVFDSAAGFDGDDGDIDGSDGERGGDPGEHVGGGVVAVQEQHVTQDAGAWTIAELVSCLVPQLLMLGAEPARNSGLDERGGRRHRAGSTPQHFEVVVEFENFAAALSSPNMACDLHVRRRNGHGLSAKTHVETLPGEACGDRLERLADTHSGFRVGSGNEAGNCRERLDGQRPHRCLLEDEFGGDIHWRTEKSGVLAQGRFRYTRGEIMSGSGIDAWMGANASGRIEPESAGSTVVLKYRPARAAAGWIVLAGPFSILGLIAIVSKASERSGTPWGALGGFCPIRRSRLLVLLAREEVPPTNRRRVHFRVCRSGADRRAKEEARTVALSECSSPEPLRPTSRRTE
jgi:hypothetical protein